MAYLKLTSLLLLLAVATLANAARLLDEEIPPIAAPFAALSVGNPAAPTAAAAVPASTGVPAASPASTQQGVSGTATASAAAAAADADLDPHHTLSFFMHDILGGTNPTARAVTGVVSNTAINAQLAFSKPNGAVLPINNGIPLTGTNRGIINNNNIPFLTGLGGQTAATVLQSNGNNIVSGNNGIPFINGAQLPAGTTLQKLLFGTMTVIDDELTEGHELGSPVVGKAQGFYVASSEDGHSQTMAFTTMFEDSQYLDSLSFFGVHRTASTESYLGVMGGTGKYVNAKGYAKIKSLPAADQRETDGVETLLQFTVYLTI
ncbi:hypothetical protein ACLOJK_001669 [Asimina triloba]